MGKGPLGAIVVGGGIGGLAASILLARQGLEVLCIEAEGYPRERVGESLDFSVPLLLQRLGLEPREVLEQGLGTYKDAMRLVEIGHEPVIARVWSWLARWPINLPIETFHVDRVGFDLWLHAHARACGVRFVEDKVERLEFEGERLQRVHTRGGLALEAEWFIDASGRARLLGRARDIPRTSIGRRKVTIWGQLPLEHDFGGTSVYFDYHNDYLTWLWRIPLDEQRSSVGYTMCTEDMQRLRRKGLSVEAIYRAAFERFPHLRAGLRANVDPLELSTCSYQPYTHERACGENWLMIGEAAAMLDPATSGGVTAALRNAESACRHIARARVRGRTSLAPRQRSSYSLDTRMLIAQVSVDVERLLYEDTLRRAFGSQKTYRIYLAAVFLPGSVYSRLSPRSHLGIIMFAGFLRVLQWWGAYWLQRAKREQAELAWGEPEEL